MRFLILLISTSLFSQVAFEMTEVERLKFELIKKDQEIQKITCAPLVSNLQKEFSDWKKEVLKNHNNPKDVIFNDSQEEFITSKDVTGRQMLEEQQKKNFDNLRRSQEQYDKNKGKVK